MRLAKGARALVVDHGQHVVVEEVDEALHGHHLHAAVAVAEALHLQQKHQSDDFFGHHFARAASVRHDEVFLQGAQILFGDAVVAERAEAGGHAVDGLFGVLHLLV